MRNAAFSETETKQASKLKMSPPCALDNNQLMCDLPSVTVGNFSLTLNIKRKLIYDNFD